MRTRILNDEVCLISLLANLVNSCHPLTSTYTADHSVISYLSSSSLKSEPKAFAPYNPTDVPKQTAPPYINDYQGSCPSGFRFTWKSPAQAKKPH